MPFTKVYVAKLSWKDGGVSGRQDVPFLMFIPSPRSAVRAVYLFLSSSDTVCSISRAAPRIAITKVVACCSSSQRFSVAAASNCFLYDDQSV